MFQARDLPLLGKEGKRAEERGEWGGTKERERSEPPYISAQRSLLKTKDALSRGFNGGSLRSHSLVPPRSPRSSARYPSYPRRGTLLVSLSGLL